jgi:S1-C subfamily serine protease
VRAGSPAEAAGLQVGDLVVEANGQAIVDPAALRNLEGLLPVGEPVPVVVLREGQRRTLLPVLRAQPRELDGGALDARLEGAAFAELPERWRQQGLIGVVVSKLDPEGRAAASGLRQGDLVYGVGRARIDDLQALQDALGAAPGDALPLAVVRGRREGVLVMR